MTWLLLILGALAVGAAIEAVYLLFWDPYTGCKARHALNRMKP
jgi:hypothetical protein